MKMTCCAPFVALVASAVLLTQCQGGDPNVIPPEDATNSNSDSLKYEGETHLANLRQLTYGGDNAEAYWANAFPLRTSGSRSLSLWHPQGE